MAIYNGTQKVAPSSISKVYVGNQLVYQEQTGGWHTLWEGSISVTQDSASSTINLPDMVTQASQQEYKFRVTFSCYSYGYKSDLPTVNVYAYYNANSSKVYLYNKSSSSSDISESYSGEVILENNASSKYICVYSKNSWKSSSIFLSLNTASKLASITIDKSSGSPHTVSMTVTKIEQYY